MTTEEKAPEVEAEPHDEASLHAWIEGEEPFVPTKAADYPVDKDLELTLPSGANVVVHRPNKYALLLAGRFPKDVDAAIRESADGGEQPDFVTRIKAMDYLLCEAFVAPKLHITPKKGCLCVRELPDPDREFLVAVLRLSVF